MWHVFFLVPIVLFSGPWAETVLSEMTLEQKIGQLFVLPGCPMQEENHWEEFLDELHIGGVLVKEADSESQVRFLNALQERSKFPLLVAIDDEWGLAMTTSDAIAFPQNGEIQNQELLFALGQELGRQARHLGVHLHLAPVADVNNNPKNPIIGLRSFGEDPLKVSECVIKVMKGMQAENTLACVKHFPGHGDTEVDSHKELPVLRHSRRRFEEVEFVPFRKAIEEGVDVVMIGHLLADAIDPEWPATLSLAWVHSLLKEKMGFQGLVITDALNMQALDSYSPEEAAFFARRAGCDLLLYGAPTIDWMMRNHILRAHRALVEAYQEGKLDREELDQSVLKILKAKEKVGLNRKRTVPVEAISEFLWRPAAVALQEKLKTVIERLSH